MEICKKIVAVAVFTFLFAVIVQSASFSRNAEESHVVKRGISDCPHDCWGAAGKCEIAPNSWTL